MVHRLARLMMAAIFVFGGVDILRHPQKRVETATPFLESLAKKVGESLPDKVPTDPDTLVKLDAAVKVVAGLGLALGRFPRLSALILAADLIPTTLAAHSFWEHEDPTARAGQRTHFLKNLGLAGGLVIAATHSRKKS